MRMEGQTVKLLPDEDGDVKIAGSAAQQIVPDDGEVAAMEFNEQKQNGNIAKAYELGDQLAALLFTVDQVLEDCALPQYARQEVIRTNARVLFAFVAGIMLEHGCPNSVTARTALNYFHRKVEERSPQMYRSIVESGALSLYILCARDARMALSCIGSAFADGCDKENEEQVVRLGDRLYNAFYQLCKHAICGAEFLH